MVFGRLKAEQRKPEAVLPAALAVAAATVAAILGEDRHDLADEVDRGIVAHPLYHQRHRNLGRSLGSGHDPTLPVGQRHEHAARLNSRQGGWLHPPRHAACGIDLQRRAVRRGSHDQLPSIPASNQPHGAGLGLARGDGNRKVQCSSGLLSRGVIRDAQRPGRAHRSHRHKTLPHRYRHTRSHRCSSRMMAHWGLRCTVSSMVPRT